MVPKEPSPFRVVLAYPLQVPFDELLYVVGVEGQSQVEELAIVAEIYCRRARYTPRRMIAPPTTFSMPSTSPKKMIPEATPVIVIKYW